MASKQKVLSVSGLLSGAMVWGLMWYPYRIRQGAGVSGELATLLTYVIALMLGLLATGPVWRELRIAGWWGIAIMLVSGWTNYGYVLAILDGEVMRVLLLFYLAPLWTVIFARWMLGEKLNHYGYAIIALSLGGGVCHAVESGSWLAAATKSGRMDRPVCGYGLCDVECAGAPHAAPYGEF